MVETPEGIAIKPLYTEADLESVERRLEQAADELDMDYALIS